MCYDIKVSLSALIIIINIVSCIILFIVANKHKDAKQLKVCALFFGFVGIMQLWDSIFWTYDGTTKINKYSTKIAMIWNHLEPIVLGILIYFFIGKLTIPSMIILTIYVFASIFYTINAWKNIGVTEVTNETCGSLYWQWNYSKGHTLFYGLFLCTLLVLSQQNFNGWVRFMSVSIILITFFFSFYKYSINASVGRFWCYFAALSPIFFLIMV
jgi:hypothetical protein